MKYWLQLQKKKKIQKTVFVKGWRKVFLLWSLKAHQIKKCFNGLVSIKLTIEPLNAKCKHRPICMHQPWVTFWSLKHNI